VAKHMECGCWLTDDLRVVEGVCDAYKAWEVEGSSIAYQTATTREREACAQLVEECRESNWWNVAQAIRNRTNAT